METNKVNQLLMTYKDSIDDDKMLLFKNALESIPDERYDQVVSNLAMTKLHNPTTILLMSIFLGGFGVDRFMLGDVGLGIGKLLVTWLTCGFGSIWPLVDIFFSYKRAKELNLDKLMQALR